MGRGLSELQRTILRLAYANREQENDLQPNVYAAEVVAAHYGQSLPAEVRRSDGKRNHDLLLRRGTAPFATEAQHAAIARAASRLVARGLLVRDSWKGYNLTVEGIDQATETVAASVAAKG